MLSDQLGEAANYIKSMQEKIENMKGRKKHMAETKEIDKSTDSEKMDFQLPHIEIQDLGSALVVLLICGLDYQFVFYRTILILEEEGVEVVNASFFVMGDKAFHTIHCKVNITSYVLSNCIPTLLFIPNMYFIKDPFVCMEIELFRII